MKKILSTFSRRMLTIACGLFVCICNAFAVYFEAIEANKEFYVYNVANGKYLTISGTGLVLKDNITEASTWSFSGKSGKVSMKSGNNYLTLNEVFGTKGEILGAEYTSDPGPTATGSVTIGTSVKNLTLGGDHNGYTMSISQDYGFKIWGMTIVENVTRTYYLSSTPSKSVQTISDAIKWKLVSKRQIDNTVLLNPTNITLEAIPGGLAVEKQFEVNHNGAPTSITITNGSTALTILSPTKPTQVKVIFQVAADGSKTITLSDANNTSNTATYSFNSSTDASLTLTVSTSAASGDAIDADKKTVTITGVVSNLKYQYIDWTQDFTSLTPASTPIPLSAVAKDANGNPTGKSITYSVSSTGIVQIINDKLYVLGEGITSITAKVANDATYIAAEKTLTVKVSGMPASAITITSVNAPNPGIFTGTVGGAHPDHPSHVGLRSINLEKCFDNNDNALFDTLYIFGVTSNTDGSLVSYKGTNGVQYTNVSKINTPNIKGTIGSNAVVPCYVFARTNTTTYTYIRSFDAAKTRYDWGNKQNGNHIYFTGYCPFAYVGVTPQENGWMSFAGESNNTSGVDIYLDSCQIMAQYKTQSGKNAGYENYELHLNVTKTGSGTANVNINYLLGSSSIFVFTNMNKDENKPYKPTIHTAGKNHLRGQLGCIINKTIGDANLVGMVQASFNIGLGGVNTYSAPISIKPTDIGQYTDLTLTDIWKDQTITNGYLKLDAPGARENIEVANSIDLGSANGSLTINGGQYHLRNAAADGNYTCNLAIGYKMYSQTVQFMNNDIQVQLYGFGNDQVDSKVIINAGTFTMHKNVYPDADDAYGYLGSDYYTDKTNALDLRLPAGSDVESKARSRINGGTFNGISNVVMCKSVLSTGASPMNALELPLSLKDVSATIVDGMTQFDLTSITGIDGFYDPAPYVTYNLVEDIEMVEGGSLYGGQSVNRYTKDGNDIVTLLLPSELYGEDVKKEVVVLQWVTALPLVDVKKTLVGIEYTMSIAGPTEVKVISGEDLVYETNQLMYTDLEGLEGYEYTLTTQGAGLKIAEDEDPRGQISNENAYTIQRNLNIIKVVQADTWYAFTAPFDINMISVIETANNNAINNPELSRESAMKLQAEANLKVWYGAYTFMLPNEFGRTTPMSFDELLGLSSVNAKKYILKHYNGDKQVDNNYGTNLYNANYYLYELASEEFATDGTGKTLNIVWKPVRREGAAGQALMKKGKTYAIQFPYCPTCDDFDTRKYDYWSNKMILFQGKGPQRIEGSNHQSEILTSPAVGNAKLVGNSTFVDMNLSRNQGYVHDTSDDFFKLYTNYTSYPVKPTQGLLLYNSGSAAMPARISRSGQMVYPDNTTTDVEDVPTIGDRTSIMLFDAMDGFEVLSLCEQVVTIYNLQGNLIFRQQMAEGEQVHIAAAEGIYVVKGEKEAIKVMVD